ncbi:MAG: DUF448 domain-containing protein [Candidatus Cloacimonetes bacterium]|nr:DUF448 domain-containing protein [Candidatus Cloacimonadota bacterium]
MPNRASRAGHIPERICVVCRSKRPQSALLRFVVRQGRPVFDLRRRLPGRGQYVCDANKCIEGLNAWLRKRAKRHRRFGSQG